MATIEGVDYSWARPGAAVLKAAGKHFAVRYLFDDGQGGKGLDASEIADFNANGVDVAIVYESTARRALDGRAAGQADAHAAQAQLQSVGLPAGIPIYFAVDFDTTEANQAGIDEYLRGVADVIGLARTGVYGSFYVVERCANNGTAKWFWQTYAWSGGQVSSHNHILQYLNGQNINGAVDFCRATQDNYGQASANGGPAPTPTPTPAPQPSGQTYSLTRAVQGFVTAANAASHSNSNSTVQPGNYAVFSTSNGMINITRVAGVPGWWINPNDNGAPVPAPAPATGGFAVGDTVNVTNPVDVNGTKLNVSGDYTVMEVSGSRVVIGRGGTVTAAVNAGNLAHSGGSAPAPAPQGQFVTVQAGWGLSNVAQAAGYGDAGSSARWAAIAELNGSNNWQAFNAALKPGQSVRVA